MNNAISKYLRQIQTWLPCSNKAKATILMNIKSTITSTLAADTSPSLQDLYSQFGTPQQIAAAHVDEMDTALLLRQLRIRKRIVTIILIAICIALAIWLGTAFIALLHAIWSDNGFYTISIFEVT